METVTTGTTGTTPPPHKLTTTLTDPATGDVYVLETIQGEGETLTEFITRHRAAVSALRRILKGS
jgi:hypothetical protein